MALERKVVVDVSGWLRVFDDGSVDRTWTGPPEVKFMSNSVPPHEDFIEGVATKDAIINPKSGLRVRIYLPEKNNYDKNFEHHHHKLPIILHFHGGGFCVSQADWYMYYAGYTRLARVTRAVIVSVYLRLAPENRLPAACEDGYAALLWLSSLAQGKVEPEPWLRAHADFTRVFLIGDSSGGNIVHHVAARAAVEELTPLKLAGAIPIHPGFVRKERSKSELEQQESPLLTLDMVDNFLKLSLPIGSTKDHPITCPMGESAVPKIKDLNLPPYLLCVAENDMIKDTDMEFYEALKKANKEVELLMNYGVGHSFYLNKIAVDTDPITAMETENLFTGIAEFIKKH